MYQSSFLDSFAGLFLTFGRADTERPISLRNSTDAWASSSVIS